MGRLRHLYMGMIKSKGRLRWPCSVVCQNRYREGRIILGVILMFCFWVIQVLLSRSSLKVCRRSFTAVYTQQARVRLLLVLRLVWRRISILMSGNSKLVHWCWLIRGFAWLMSLTRWANMIGRRFTRPWSSRQFRYPRRGLWPRWGPDARL